MESDHNSLLNVPITEAERRAQRSQHSQSSGDDSRTLVNTPDSTQHARDRQFNPQIGRFSSLRYPGERYDDPDQHYPPSDNTLRPTLPDIDEESNFSDHHDEEPINPPLRSTTIPKTDNGTYQPVQNAPAAQVQPLTQRFWQPIWLKKAPLASLAIFIAGLLAALIAVCHSADINNGFYISSSAEHYAWTYVPTAIMVLVVALVRQVDFHTKSLIPWRELRYGPTSPYDSVLVDYISDFQIFAFLAAFKRLHVPVMITVAAFVMAKALTIASTGLFYPQPTTFTSGYPTVLTSEFDASALDSSILSTTTFPNTSVYTYYLNVMNGFTPTLGVASGFAYTLPMLQSDSNRIPGNATFNVTTDTFIPSISCRPANVTLRVQATVQTVNFPYNSTDLPYGSPANLTFDINESELCSSWPQLTFRGLDPLHYVVPGQQLESKMQEISCNDPDASPIILFMLVETLYSQTLLANVSRPEGGELPIALNTSRSVSRMTSILCQADYTLGQVNITNNTALQGLPAITLVPLDNARNRTLDGLSSANMTTIYSNLLGSTNGLFLVIPQETTGTETFRTPAFDLLQFAAGLDNYNQFFDGTSLQNAAIQTYMGTMPAFASNSLTRSWSNSSARSGSVATISWTEDRVYANWTPVILVTTGLGILAVLLIVLVILRPESVVPRDPNSIAAAATVMSRSFELNRLLKKLQSPRNKGIAAALNGYEVGTAIAIDEDGAQSFKIHVTEGRPQRDVQEITPNIKFWHPVWASIPVLVLTICVPLLLIAILEVLQHMSDTNHGLLDVPDDKSSIIGSHYVSAFVMLLVASLINNIDFYVALYAPWSNLNKANAMAEHSILTNVLGHITPSAILTAVKGRYWGALSSALATIAAGLLTVIVSGLFLVETFDTVGPARSLFRLDDWNIAQGYSAYAVNDDHGAGAMLNLIEHNSSFPAFTYKELAFPKMEIGSLQTNVKQDSMIVGGAKAVLPALRGNLTCEDPSGVTLATIDSAVRVTAFYDVSDACLSAIDTLENNSFAFATDFTLAAGAVEFGGRQFDLRFGANSSIYGHLGEANSSLVGDNPAAGCPSLAFVWGNFELGKDDTTAVNVLVCYQKVLDVNANVTMQQNTTEIDPRYQPAVDERSGAARPNPNETMTSDIFDFRIQDNLARQLNGFGTYSSNIDPFFQAMINGSKQMDIETIVRDRQMAFMRISHTYRLYMAQVFNLMMRGQTSNLALRERQASTLDSLQTTMTMSRLVLDRPSKIILQVLLGLTAILILVGYVLTKMRDVLPCNPCSIAGTMSLLAGSDLCYAPDKGICECCGKLRRSLRSVDGRQHMEGIHAEDDEHEGYEKTQLIRQGAEWMDDEHFKRVFKGQRYSLGWWEANSKQGKTKRYGVDIGVTPDGAEVGDWYLGRRKDNDTFEIFADQVDSQDRRGRARALSDVNERGQYQRAEPSPGVEEHEMRRMDATRGSGREARYAVD
ncbi:hypothetical protein H2198_009087 [Neophaeococcomyces mojaviensis]|uniref:Uncharacterized protein n=1 Tax=Neophaeococcomyces mojaviensis TaxID=3383035 RepID=A0ACC2ZVL7_9EURO|nr:hypothetical protein H2198_009087 [Knufia sp. JES_112]